MLGGLTNKQTLSNHSTTDGNDSDVDYLLLQLVRKHLQKAPLPQERWENWEPGLMALSRGILMSTLRPSPTLLPFISASGILSPALNASIVAGRLNNEREKVNTFKNLLRLLEKLTLNPSLISPMMYLLLRLGDKHSITPNTPSSCSPANLETMAFSSSATSAAAALAKRLQAPPQSPSTQYSRQKLNYLGSPNPFNEIPRQPQHQTQSQSQQQQQPNIAKKITPWTPSNPSLSLFEQYKQSKLEYEINQCNITDIIPLLRGLKKIPANMKSSTGQTGVFKMFEEMGTLYSNLIRDISCPPAIAGAVRMGFNRALEKETLPYLQLVAEYESKMAGMSLCETLTLFKPQRRILSFLTLLNQDSSILHGLPLLQRIRSYGGEEVHGDPNLASIVTRILEAMLPPLLDTLAQFISEGVLMDPEMEFSITTNYNTNNLPYIIRMDWLENSDLFLGGPGMTEKVLLIGLTRKFILDNQVSSLSLAMEDAYPKNHNHNEEQRRFFNPQEISKLIIKDCLNSFILQEHSQVMNEFISLMIDKLSLKEHLQGIRNYLHFGCGDFASSLVSILQPLLDRPSSSLQRHPLVSGMEESCRESVKEGVRAFLDVRLHDLSGTTASQIPSSKILGWDVFTLDYRVPSSLQTFLTTDVMEEVVRVSHFLFSLRRVRQMLSNSWRRLKISSTSLEKINDLEGLHYCKEFLLTIREGRQMVDGIDGIALEIVNDSWLSFMSCIPPKDGSGMDLLSLRSKINQFTSSLFEDLFLISSSPIKRSLAGLLSVLLKMEYGIKAIESKLLTTTRGGGGDSWNDLRENQTGNLFSIKRGLSKEFSSFILELEKEEMSAGLDGAAAAKRKRYIGDLLLSIDYSSYHKRKD